MASLTLSVGSLISTLEISDAHFVEIARLLANGAGIEGSNQERLDWLTRDIANSVKNKARQLRNREAATEARSGIDAEFAEQWRAVR